MSNVFQPNSDEEVKAYFDENVFYPRLLDSEKLINEAKKKAMQILQDAETQAYETIQSFKEEGIRQGLQEVKSAAKILQSINAELKEFRERFAESIEPVVVDLALKISKKIIKKEVALKPGIVRENVKAALGMIMEKKEIIIQVNPSDQKLLQTYESEIKKNFPEIASFLVETNEMISRGGCKLRSTKGEIDATLETQFSQISKSLGRTESL